MKLSLNKFFWVGPLAFWILIGCLSGTRDLWAQTFDAGQGYFLSSSVNSGPEGIGIGDLDEDGNLDLVTADNGFLSLFHGDGAGGFPSKTALATRPSNATGTIAADDNESVLLFEGTGDGHLDLLAPNLLSQFTALTLFKSNPAVAGQFLTPATRITQGIGTTPAAVAPLHLNPGQDNFIDLALITSNSPKVRTFIGDGAGKFTPGLSFTLSTSPSSAGEGIDWGDMNEDGLTDIVVVDRQRAWVLLNNGMSGLVHSGSATSSLVAGFHLEFDVALGDFNGDQHLDAAVANGGIFGNLTSTLHSVAVFLGDGQGGLSQTPTSIDLGSEVSDVEVGDFDNDGNLDILAAVPDFLSTQGKAAVIRGNGDGTFDTQGVVELPALGIGTVCVATADLDKDGRLDVVLGNEGLIAGGPTDIAGNITVYLSTLPDIGTATPTPTATASPTPTPTRTPIESQDPDINRDGFRDAKDLIILLEQQGNQSPNP
ncbi:MAG: VCBS repeat-containing protein [Candidatus Omnitrophica bacterium]|nr:VCBS repeat-containing protein [Candidatus Omnitrophota bacterium]